jgi:hypothetical protein
MIVEDIERIREIKRSVEADWINRPGVTGIDVGYKYIDGKRTDEIAIRIHVMHKRDVPEADAVPATIDGITTDVIESNFVPQVIRVRADTLQGADTGKYDPLEGGISIGPCRSVGGYVYAGTAGVVVEDRATGQPMLLSNFHVMCLDKTWRVGDSMTQPSLIDTGSCPTDVVAALQRASLGGEVDRAVAAIQARGNQCQIAEIGAVRGTATATLGVAVRKRGRTTGLTYGSVDAIDLTVTINYGSGIGYVTLTNQIDIAPDKGRNPLFSDHGDSGSVVVDDSAAVVGSLFAGDSSNGTAIANPISTVCSILNVTLCR